MRLDGNDSNVGTSDTPEGAWLTLSKAKNMAIAGDIVNIGAGVWSPSLGDTIRGGTDGNPIVFQGAPDQTTILGYCRILHDYVHIKNLQVQSTTLDIGGQADYALIENIRFTGGGAYSKLSLARNDISYTGPLGTVIRDCYFGTQWPRTPAVGISASSVLMEDCTFEGSGDGDAIILLGQNNTIRGCTFKWTRYPGGTNHVDIFQAFTNNLEISKYHVIERCFVYGGTNTQLGNVTDISLTGGVSDWTFRNNVFLGPSNPLNLYTPNFKFYNNTWAFAGAYVGNMIVINTSLDRGTAHGTTFINNIFYKCGSLPTSSIQGFFSYQFDTGAPNFTGININNNLVIGTGAGTTKSGPWTWYSANAAGINGIDPLFVQPVAPSLPEYVALLPTSPAIGAGQNLSAFFTTDFYGNVRSGWDLGAIDSSTPPADTTPPSLSNASIDSTGANLTLTFSENVTSVSAIHYSLSTGQTLGGVEEIGPVVTMTISPVITAGETVTLSYSSGAGRTADEAGNLLATFSNIAVTNNSLESTPDPPRATGRGASARRILR